jgi:predicted hydrolase (HD superfamily)
MMEDHIPTYDEALKLLKEFNQMDSLIKHAYAVEGAMRYIASTMGEDEEK